MRNVTHVDITKQHLTYFLASLVDMSCCPDQVLVPWSRVLGKLDNTTSVQITVQSQHTFQISTVIAVNFSSENAGSSVGPLIPNYHYREFHYCGISRDKQEH